MAGLLILFELLACILPFLATNQQQHRQHSSLLILSEICYYPINMTIIQHQLDKHNVTVDILDRNELCQDQQKILQFLSRSSHLHLIGSLDPDVCAPANHLALYFNVTVYFWNCPPITRKKTTTTSIIKSSEILQSSPLSIIEIARGFARVVADMKWKSVAIIGIASGWWPLLAQTLELELRDLDIVPKHSAIFDKNVSLKYIEKKLISFTEKSCQAIIFCLSATDTGMKILQISSKLHFPIDNILFIFMDALSLPSWKFHLHKIKETTLLENVLFFLENNTWNEQTIENNVMKNINETFVIDKRLFTSSSSSSSFSSFSSPSSSTNSIQNDSFQQHSVSACFVLAEIHLEDNSVINFHSLLKVFQINDSQHFQIEFDETNFDEWLIRHKQLIECGILCQLFRENLFSSWIYWLLACSIVIILLLLTIMAFVKYRLLMKGNLKSPYKVLLSTADFDFPQLTDSRGVDEGIETMLCCLLQGFQEFGGPEVDKPDLLQNSSNGGSGGGAGVASASIRTPLQASSTPNLAKKSTVSDHRVRYNGDPVQMKPVPSSNNIELKAKSIEIIALLHGLRHENLNPLIGILAAPPKAVLVSEYCTRGSLQDVLQQDDIKLDWSFRLSLLTDLVRGMKYLHSTQIRVHGYLTSRNCVIDSRWVLKITDYGLPYFYEAQNISPPTKTARELLWTAPELLRHSALRKKGTQPGDVYSFGIILQQVVVRGEPFCMLALSPEEIIEKVKHPPPLIRPSVSMGAAPPEAINIMRQCWLEQADKRPDFNEIHDQFQKLNKDKKGNIIDTMFQMLEKYSNNLEDLIRKRTEQLDIEKKKTEQLLNRMLPSYVAEKLKLGMPVDPEEYEEVTIYFSDIVGFTTISAHSTPFQVVDLLNDLYTCFDATINAYNVYKVETIGDAYMVVGGLPVRIPDHAEQIATMALDLLHQSGKFRIRHLPGTPLRLRIGLHTGPCCAGVVGLTMPRYCLFGDTVNTASRMESTGAAWRIHMSDVTHMRLQKAGGYQIEYRGLTEIKGKGTMDTYWLLAKDGFNKELPVPPSIEESHGLDEGLIINSMQMTMPEIVEDSLADSLSIESLRHLSVSEGHTKASSPNPTFIRSMEVSKFSSLNRYDDRISIYSDRITKSTSGENSINLGVPVCASDVAAALLGTSTNSLCPYRREHRGPGKIKEEYEDISTPYSHYKSLSPKHRTGKLLRRQFSLDRSEDANKMDEQTSDSPRLCKQNSAGAAADLEKIEEIPSRLPSTIPSISSQIHCMISVSADSLIRQ